MSNKKATKRALLTSVLAICLCLVMLIGSTFAWFTDTASTGVNQIQSGTLDVELVKPDQEEGKYVPLGADALKWVAKDGRNQEEIFWEPGASYNLEGFRIKNNGNLALKYKIVISGIVGNAELLNAIDFTYKIGEASLDLNEEGHLKAGEVSEVIAINGKMKETAGNEYMNKSITGIAITVYATQDTVEADSFGTTYDENAAYKLTINTVATGNLNVTQQENETNAKVKNDQTISSGAVSVTYPDGTVLKEDVTVTGEVDKKATVEQKLEYKGDTARGGEILIQTARRRARF